MQKTPAKMTQPQNTNTDKTERHIIYIIPTYKYEEKKLVYIFPWQTLADEVYANIYFCYLQIKIKTTVRNTLELFSRNLN